MKLKGAFVDACEYVINKDMDSKRKLLKEIIDNPDKYPPITGVEMCELIFGDYQRFANKFKGL